MIDNAAKLEKLRFDLRELSEVASLSTLSSNGTRQVFWMPIQSKNIAEVWKYCRRRFDATGFWPAVSFQHSFFYLEHWGLSPEQQIIEVIQRGEAFQWESWLPQEENVWKEVLGEPDYEEELKGRHGEWPSESKNWYKSLPTIPDAPGADPGILLVEVEKFWHVPAVLKMDWIGWGKNRQPRPDVHVGVMKYLCDRFGGELHHIEGDSYLLEVTRHPGTREEALQLAYGINLYASDLIDEFVESFEKLAVTLMSSSKWLFWWD